MDPDTTSPPAAPTTGPQDQSASPVTAAPPATTGKPATGEDTTDWQAEAERWKSEARKHEGRAKGNKQAAEQQSELMNKVAAALGLQQDGTPDPAQLTTQIEQARADAWRSNVELAVYRKAASLGGDPDTLLDSMAFINSLDDLVEIDPRSAEFADAVKQKVAAAIKANPRLKTTPTVPARSGSAASGGPGEQQKRPTSLTDAVRRSYG